MITLRNINKRRELQEDVYNNYTNLTEDERRELNNEVGAAYRGYETAMRDIIQLLVNGDKVVIVRLPPHKQANYTKSPCPQSSVKFQFLENVNRAGR